MVIHGKFKGKKKRIFSLKLSSEPGKGKHLATAPMARMMASAKMVLESVKTLKGVEEKSTLVTVSMKISVPKWSSVQKIGRVQYDSVELYLP